MRIKMKMKLNEPVLGLAGFHIRKLQVHGGDQSPPPHCGIASLAQVSTMGLCPLQIDVKFDIN